MRHVVVALYILVVFTFDSVTTAGPKGTVIVNYLPPGTLTTDGDFSDWPFDRFTEVARQPPFPQARDSAATDAIGDHLLFEVDRVGFFNDSSAEVFEETGDFGAVTYFAHDGAFLHILAVVIDDTIRDDRDTTEFGSSGFLNDGFEFFIDARGDSLDRADEISFPNFDEEEPNVDDMQITVGLNENFPSPLPGVDFLGARQGIERAGDTDLIGENKNGPGGLYRDVLDNVQEVQPDIVAKFYEDLREANAPNPELEGPGTFTGYAVEMKVPWVLTSFPPENPVGFDLFWRDFDAEDEPGAGGAGIVWMDWAQNTTVASNDAGEGLFHTANWGQLIFAPVSTLGDFNADGAFDKQDLDRLVMEVAAGGDDSQFDMNADGVVDKVDVEQWLTDGAAANGLESPYLWGDSNLDLKVDAMDLNNMAVNWQGSPNSWMGGDFDGSGSVDAGDLNLLALNWQKSSAAADGAQTVPEPAALWLCLSCAVPLVSCRRRKENT
jgi:hypothetical protein